MIHRTTIVSITLIAGLLGFTSTLSAAPGDLDPTFSQDGKLLDSMYGISDDRGYATAVQPDGKVVVAGTLNSSRELIGIIRYQCGIARYNTDGTLDASFDGDGKLQTSLSSLFLCNAVGIQSDGKIIVAGSTSPSGPGADFALMRFNSNGTPDTSFDSDGKVTTNIAGYDAANALVIQPDGKIVAAGSSVNTDFNANFAVVRYNSNGSLDTSFDGDGKILTDFSFSGDFANAVALQSDGKIVVAGRSSSDFGLARYNADGSLDTSFDLDGKVTTSAAGPNESSYARSVMLQTDGKIVATGIGGFTAVRYNTDGSLDTTFDLDGKVTMRISPNYYDDTLGAVLQDDGKIVLAGYGYFFGSREDIALVRYNTDGSLDTTFGGGDGVVTTDFFLTNERASAVALAANGRIVAAGYFSLGSSDNEFSVARYNPDGTLDTSFDGDGKTFTPMGFPVNSSAGDVATQADGKVVVVGYAYNGANDDFMVARYNVDGTPDLTFGTAGKVTTDGAGQSPFGDRASAVAIQPDGKILVGGVTNAGGGNNPDFAVLRYNPNGTPDMSFDGDGIATTSFASSEYALDIAIQPDGKIVAVGYVFVSGGTDFAVARYNADGSPDLSFDGDGKLTTDFAGFNDRAEAVAIQTDGKIVVAGGASRESGSDFGLARYNSDGSLDTSFDDNGRLTTDFAGQIDYALAIAVQADGKIIAAGTSGPFNGSDFALARYNQNGSLDPAFDGDGKVITNIQQADVATGIAVQHNGRIVVGGYGSNGAQTDAAIARYSAEGTLDSSFGAGGTRTFDMGIAAADTINGLALDPRGRIVIAGETYTGTTENLRHIAIAKILPGPASAPFDFDGDSKTDVSIFRPGSRDWWYLRSSDGQSRAENFGNSTDRLVPGDYTGDGKTDLAVWRPSSGEWFILRSEGAGYYAFPFGADGDIPVPADYDGDGKTDAAVFRPSNSGWYISKSSGGIVIQQFGQAGDVPVPADYDGDGSIDIAIYRPSLGQWWIDRSTAGGIALTFGTASDKAVPGDYTGDGKSDVAFFRPSTGEWFVLRSETFNTYYAFPFGAIGDVPTAGDYDGDGKFDSAVFRPSNSTWWVNRSTSGLLIRTFGQSGDIPVPAVFVF